MSRLKKKIIAAVLTVVVGEYLRRWASAKPSN